MGTYVVKVTGQFPPEAVGEHGADLPRHLKEFGATGDGAGDMPAARGLRTHEGRWVLEADDVVMAIGLASAAYKAAAERSGLDLPVGVRVSVERSATAESAVGAPPGARTFAAST